MVLVTKWVPRRGPVWLKPRVVTRWRPYDLKYWYASLSCATLLTAYGDRGRSGFVSFIGTSSGCTRPYSSDEPAMWTRIVVSWRRIASRRLSWDSTLIRIVAAGSSNEDWTNDCAARWKTRSGRRGAMSFSTAPASVSSQWSSVTRPFLASSGCPAAAG